jgi:hypothetical protein
MVPSMVIEVTLVHLSRSPGVKSSAKITAATVTGSEAPLMALALSEGSTASTV